MDFQPEQPPNFLSRYAIKEETSNYNVQYSADNIGSAASFPQKKLTVDEKIENLA
jgi:hypothetical protein